MSQNSTRTRFTDRDVRLIKRSLPPCAKPNRVSKLGRVLRDWCLTDLQEHLAPRLSKHMHDRRNKQLSIIAQQAQTLSEAIQALDKESRALLAYVTASLNQKTPSRQTHSNYLENY